MIKARKLKIITILLYLLTIFNISFATSSNKDQFLFIFGDIENGPKYKLIFNKNNTFISTWSRNSEELMRFEGKYYFANNKKILKIRGIEYSSHEIDYDSKKIKNTKKLNIDFKLKKISDDIYIRAYISNKYSIVTKNFMRKNGSNYTISNTPVVFMGNISCITNENVRLRASASINSDALEFYTYNIYLEEKKNKYIPKNTSIIIIARSRRKYRVKRWYNYWYYVDLSQYHGYHDEILQNNKKIPRRAWVYGEFIKIK